jgi:peptidyl-prolyl cis-trans isomerase D
MLQAFRSKGLTSVIYGVLIVGMVLVFVLGFNPSAGKQKASLGEQCAARVKGHCITPKDHMAAYRMLIPRGEQGEPQLQRAKQMNILRVSLDGLIERELLVNDAERLGLTVTEDEVTDAIFDGIIHVSYPSDKSTLGPPIRRANFHDPKTKKFEVRIYERQIKALEGRSPAEFREEQVREMLAAKVRDIVRTPVRVSESEALASYIDEKSTATFNTITVRPSYLLKYLPPPTDKEVAAWAADEANKKVIEPAAEAKKTPHLRHILVKVEPSASDAAKDAAKARILAALARIKHGESFAAVAKDVSEDGSAIEGGDLGTDQTDGFVAPFKEAADKLKPGEMTEAPVQTDFGYHLILRDLPMTDEQRNLAAAADLLAKVKAEGAAKAMADKIQAELKAGKDAQKILDEQIATLMPKSAKPADPKPADPKPADAKLGDAAAPATPVKTKETADTDSFRPQLVTSSPFNRAGEPVPGLSPADNAKVIQFAFTAKDKDGYDDVLKAGPDFVLVSLKEHKLATKDDFTKDKDAYLAGLTRLKEDEAFALYMSRLKELAKNEIKVDEKYMAEKMGTAKTADGGVPQHSEEDEDEGP